MVGTGGRTADAEFSGFPENAYENVTNRGERMTNGAKCGMEAVIFNAALGGTTARAVETQAGLSKSSRKLSR